MPPGLNSTHLVLIPKCKTPEFLSQFRPISLCNVIYKIASKVIANRLRVFLDRIISPVQSAFVPGRLISDNVLLSFELNHFLNTKTRGEWGWMVLKLDVSKAYDKVEWSFLEQVMSKWYTIWFPSSGERTRQGDHLSPYLFLLCTESFCSLLQHVEREGRIWGVAVCRGAPTISHLLFADGTLIFSQASPDNSQTICEVLETYREASGQEINFSKSSVTFSRNTRDEGNRGKNKTHWVSWNRLCESKLLGGLGFRHLHLFNLAMLAKQLWRILRHPDCLLSLVLQARYFPSRDIFSATLGSHPSFTWRSVMATHDLFRAGCRWRVGSGTQIRIWADPWLPRPRSFRPITPVPVSLTEEMFWLVDSDIILSIPLSRIGAPDMFIWHYSYSDIFSVQSAYHLACSLENRLCSSSSQVLEQSWWRRVWQAKIPNKVKVFVWQACLNALPTGDNLARHIPNTSAKCPFCCSKEDRIHVFVLCPFARQVWGLSTIPLSLSSLQVPDFWGWMQAVAAGLDAPPPGCIKINFDDATFRKGLELGAGVVARDKNGACVAWLSRRFDRLGNAEIAEAMAAKEAIHLAVQRGWRSIIIEGDCANLIHKLQASEPDYSVTGPIVMDIQEAASNFLFCSFEFVRRRVML
ncbi:UNVERIFIED_CONTAM: putative mitochondrial protein [Sesamum radiatum]|uniref:Mitochondrial protein n=1 Tax=Sesamum radiatum TaxID=300843 RepID=A0AAW2M207_SESRA